MKGTARPPRPGRPKEFDPIMAMLKPVPHKCAKEKNAVMMSVVDPEKLTLGFADKVTFLKALKCLHDNLSMEFYE